MTNPLEKTPVREKAVDSYRSGRILKKQQQIFAKEKGLKPKEHTLPSASHPNEEISNSAMVARETPTGLVGPKHTLPLGANACRVVNVPPHSRDLKQCRFDRTIEKPRKSAPKNANQTGQMTEASDESKRTPVGDKTKTMPAGRTVVPKSRPKTQAAGNESTDAESKTQGCAGQKGSIRKLGGANLRVSQSRKHAIRRGQNKSLKKRLVTKENTGCDPKKTGWQPKNKAKQGRTSPKGELRVVGTSWQTWTTSGTRAASQNMLE